MRFLHDISPQHFLTIVQFFSEDFCTIFVRSVFPQFNFLESFSAPRHLYSQHLLPVQLLSGAFRTIFTATTCLFQLFRRHSGHDFRRRLFNFSRRAFCTTDEYASARRKAYPYPFDFLGSFPRDIVPGAPALLHELAHEVLEVGVDRRHAHHARLLRELQLHSARATRGRGGRWGEVGGTGGVRGLVDRIAFREI